MAFQCLTLKAPITTAADDILCDIFLNFQMKLGMIFHKNHLPADDSHEYHALFIFEKATKFEIVFCCKL